MPNDREELQGLRRMAELEAKAAGGAQPQVGAPAPAPAAAPASAAPAAPPANDSTSRFVSGNLAGGIAGVAGLPVDTALNIRDLLAAGVGTVQGMWGGNMPELSDRSRVPLSGAWNEKMMRRGGIITPDADPTSGPGRYAAAALRMAPSAAFGRPTMQQLPRALATTTAAGVASEGGRDLGEAVAGETGGNIGSATGPMLMGAKQLAKPPTTGERAVQQRKADDFQKAKEIGVPVRGRDMKIDQRQQALEERVNQDLRLPAGTALTPETIGGFNKAHWDAYDRLVKAPELVKGVTPTPRFQQEIQKIGNELNEGRSNLPETFKSANSVLKLLGEYGYAQLPPGIGGGNINVPPRAKPIPAKVTVSAIKKLRKDASTNFSSDDPAKVELAHAQRSIAQSLENLIEENLAKGSNQQLLAEYRDARTMIAKGHDVLASLDPRTGKVSPERLATLQSDRPLTGGLKQASDVARAFPGAMKEPSEGDHFARRMSPSALAHPKSAGAHFLTRLTDPVELSKPYQHFAVDPRSRLSPEAERALRFMMSTQAANRDLSAPPR